MTVEEIRAGLDECRRMPPGRPRTERLERLAEAAGSAPDRVLEAEVLHLLVRCLEYSAEQRRMPVVMGRLLKLLDAHPAEMADFEHQILWRLKWMTSTLVHDPAVPVPVCVRWMDDLENRYRQRGISLRPVLDLRADLARVTGDLPSALALLEASRAAPRDEMSDCAACESNGWGTAHWAAGDAERALEAWAPVLEGELDCAEEPHRVLSRALVPLLVAGRTEEARSAHLRGYPLVRRRESLRVSVARHIEFCALTGNEARGLEILNEHLDWLASGGEDATVRFGFLEGVAVLLRRLGELGHDALPVGSGTVASARAEAERDLAELTARYDARHGNTHTSARSAARLTRRPLLPHLPLGARTRLSSRGPDGSGERSPASAFGASGEGPAAAHVPLTDVAPEGRPAEGSEGASALLGATAVSGAEEGYAELLEEARRLTAAQHPRRDKAWARLEGSAAPTEAIRLEIEVNRAKALLEGDPEGALRALEGFLPDLESPALELDARAAMASALLRTDDREGAGKAAERILELAEEERERLTPTEYLAARRVVPLLAVATVDGSDAASVEAARRTVLAELELAAGLGAGDRVGRQHEALGWIALACGEHEEARERLDEAVAHYLKAEAPWLAYQPYMVLAQLTAHAGEGRDEQARQAERYARQAVREARAHGDEALAQASSLLVETLIRQPDRHQDVAAAAMDAAYRWEGLSEPDFLHNVFIAARAYRAQGRPEEAVSLFGQAIGRVDVPYDAEGVVRTREQYGRCLSEIDEDGRAAEQFLLAAEQVSAELLPGDLEWRRPLAELAWSAAAALENDDRAAEAVAAYRRTADLWADLGETDNRVRCLRQAAWLDFSLDDSDDPRAPSRPGPAAMRAVLDELEALAATEPSEELAALLEGTREQLTAMLDEN